MKRIILFISLLFVLSKQNVDGQDLAPVNTSCIENSDFETDENSPLQSECYAINSGTHNLPKWHKSHGTPEIKKPDPNNPQANLLYMWSRGGIYGEGVYGEYDIKAFTPYRIRIRYSSINAPGNIQLFAANGLTDGGPPYSSCGGNAPNITSKDQIAFTTQHNQGWVVQTIYRVFNNDYDFIWIYPQSNSTNQMDLYVDKLEICLDTCEGILTYFPFLIPSRILPVGVSRAGNITVTTNPFSATSPITIVPEQSTSLISSKDVFINRNFHASPTGNGEFIARIVPCQPGDILQREESLENREDIDVTQFPVEEGESGELLQRSNTSQVSETLKPLIGVQLNLFPNPANRIIKVELVSAEKGQVSFTLHNSIGSVIGSFDLDAKPGANTWDLNISQLSVGTYYLSVTNSKQTLVKKFNKF